MKIIKKIRVAFFADVLRENLDGVTYTLYNIIKRIPRDQFDYIFITPFPPSNETLIPFPVIICPYIKFPLYGAYPLGIPDFSKELRKKIDEFKPDIVHFTTPSFLGRYAVRYAQEHNIPLFSTYHTHFISYVEYYFFFKLAGGINFWKNICSKVVLWNYNRCDTTFVPTEPVKNELIDLGFNKERLVTWGRGIDMDQFNPGFRDEEYIDSLAGKNTKRILFVSRLVWEKEIKTLLGIYQQFEKNKPEIKMILTGDGPLEKYLRKRMPNAIFTGKLIGNDLSRIYASCDVFVFPSVTETFGNVVLEALASGLPCVVAAKGGPMGIVQYGKTGYHARPKDVDDFCEKILDICENPKLGKTMSTQAVKYAKSQNWDDLCKEMFSIYKKKLSQKKEKARSK